MKTATVIAVLALVLALLALVAPYWLNTVSPWVSPDHPMLRGQALVTSVPLLGVAVFASVIAIRWRGSRDARLPGVLLTLLVVLLVLLVLSGCWLLLSVLTWKL